MNDLERVKEFTSEAQASISRIPFTPNNNVMIA
jgi:hypothetical protein